MQCMSNSKKLVNEKLLNFFYFPKASPLIISREGISPVISVVVLTVQSTGITTVITTVKSTVVSTVRVVSAVVSAVGRHVSA